MNTDEVVRKLNDICLGYTDILGMVILFGSYARKEATAQSDIDLYIEPRDINVTTSRFGTSRRYRKFKYDLYNQFPVEFDLISYGGKKDLAAMKNSPLWKRIEKEGILIYDKGTETV